jgi:DNA ligase (NAD+)
MDTFKANCDNAYENGTPLIEDDVYDSLFKDARTTYKIEKNVVSPVYMGSLDKVRTQKELDLWFKNANDDFIVSEKLDGISALLFGKHMYTRGDGTNCCDISEFLEFMKIPGVPGISLAIRGELIMKKSIFHEFFSSKYKNARNLVSGQFSSKNISKNIVCKIDFVAHELINLKNTIQRPQKEQFEFLINNGFSVPIYKPLNKTHMCQESLNNLIDLFRDASEYSSDGLVMTIDKPYERVSSGNPKHSLSFKKEIETESALATVTKVVWQVSAKKRYIPVVHITPVNVSDVTISKVSGHNAKFITENGIGPGAQVLCVRSGDVIPKIAQVIKRVKHADLPSKTWNGVHVVETESSILSDVKTTTNLVRALGVKNIDVETVKKMNVKSFYDILTLTEEDLSSHFHDKTRLKILSEIRGLKSRVHDFARIVGASGVLGDGIGEKRIQIMLDQEPSFIRGRPQLQTLKNIKGFGNVIAQTIFENYEKMAEFVETCVENGVQIKELSATATTATTAVKKTICLSGFRDDSLKHKFVISTTVSKKCDALVVSNYSNSTKYQQAKKLNIPIILRSDLQKIENTVS